MKRSSKGEYDVVIIRPKSEDGWPRITRICHRVTLNFATAMKLNKPYERRQIFPSTDDIQAFFERSGVAKLSPEDRELYNDLQVVSWESAKKKSNKGVD